MAALCAIANPMLALNCAKVLSRQGDSFGAASVVLASGAGSNKGAGQGSDDAHALIVWALQELVPKLGMKSFEPVLQTLQPDRLTTQVSPLAPPAPPAPPPGGAAALLPPPHPSPARHLCSLACVLRRWLLRTANSARIPFAKEGLYMCVRDAVFARAREANQRSSSCLPCALHHGATATDADVGGERAAACQRAAPSCQVGDEREHGGRAVRRKAPLRQLRESAAIPYLRPTGVYRVLSCCGFSLSGSSLALRCLLLAFSLRSWRASMRARGTLRADARLDS